MSSMLLWFCPIQYHLNCPAATSTGSDKVFWSYKSMKQQRIYPAIPLDSSILQFSAQVLRKSRLRSLCAVAFLPGCVNESVFINITFYQVPANPGMWHICKDDKEGCMCFCSQHVLLKDTHRIPWETSSEYATANLTHARKLNEHLTCPDPPENHINAVDVTLICSPDRSLSSCQRYKGKLPSAS